MDDKKRGTTNTLQVVGHPLRDLTRLLMAAKRAEPGLGLIDLPLLASSRCTVPFSSASSLLSGAIFAFSVGAVALNPLFPALFGSCLLSATLKACSLH